MRTQCESVGVEGNPWQYLQDTSGSRGSAADVVATIGQCQLKKPQVTVTVEDLIENQK